MKIRLLLLLIILFNSAKAQQQSLNNSPQSSYYTYLYKLTDKEMLKIALNSTAVVNDGFFHTLVDSVLVGKVYNKQLPFGNYLMVTAIKNKFSYSLKDVRNVDLEFVNNTHDFQFYIKDLWGNIVENAKVEVGGKKTASFDQKTKLYRSAFPNKNAVIVVKHQGVANFFEYEIDEKYNYKEDWPFFKKVVYAKPVSWFWTPFKNIFRKNKLKSANTYKGYLVYNKPKYKPLDTVKLKAYILKLNTKPINNVKADVFLVDNSRNTTKKLATIMPYKDGGYVYNFVLADTLGLKLDQWYGIKLINHDSKVEMIYESFKYEDYELKSIKFNVRTDKTEHRNGEPITAYLRATDENDLAVPDGRVNITAFSNNITAYHDAKVFVPDTLWTKQINLDPVGETKLTLPDNIFPRADLNFQLKFEFRNSNNETRTDIKYLNYKYINVENKLLEITASLRKDSLEINYKENHKILSKQATIIAYSLNDKKLDSFTVVLPSAIKTNYNAEFYAVKTVDGFKEDIFLSDFNPTISLNAQQTKDSLKVVVANENEIPFWYTIFSGNQILQKGYTSKLDTVIKHGSSKAVYVRLNYFWDNNERYVETRAVYNPNFLNIKLVAPDLVYPGQKVNMGIKVTDVNDNPVPKTDLTAYAITSKFGNLSTPNLSVKQKNYGILKRKERVQADRFYFNGSINLNWQKWGKALRLDTITYFKFTHPKELYTYTESIKDTTAQVSPFVMINGAIEPVHIIHIDGIPVYFSGTSQLQRYAFKVKPGLHSINLRTANREVNIAEIELQKGKKTVISIAADTLNTKATITKQPNSISTAEAEDLNRYLIKVANNFDDQKTTIATANEIYLLNNQQRGYNKDDLIVGPFKENLLTFTSSDFSHNFIKEPGYTYTFWPDLLKQKSYSGKYAFNTTLKNIPLQNNDNYKQYAFKKGEVDSIWNEYLNLRSATTNLFHNSYSRGWRLEFSIDTAFKNKLPYIKSVILYKTGEPDFVKIYSGNTTVIYIDNAGIYKLMFLLKDNSYFTTENVQIHANGKTYYKWDEFKIQKADQFSKTLDQQIKAAKSNRVNSINEDLLNTFNDTNFDQSLLIHTMTGFVFDEKDNTPLPGVAVKVLGLKVGVQTDSNGFFTIKVPLSGKITINYLGYEPKEFPINNGSLGKIYLSPSSMALNEVVVVGYGSVKKKDITGSVSMQNELSGRLAGVSVINESTRASQTITIRGISGLSSTEKPLIIVDGIPFTGDLNQLQPNDVIDMVTLKDQEATAIYGARAANGVIIIKTKKGNTAVNSSGELIAQQQTMRTNFSDVGFWQPQLITNDEGFANFSVKFPDDITNWTTRIIAINGKNQVGFTETAIKSFKSLSANFVAPLFATIGDSINVIGKLMNYTPFEETVSRKFTFNNKELNNQSIKFKNAHIDTLAITATTTDSLKFEYTLQQDNGYFDGELRKIPVTAAGVKETKGFFNAIMADTTLKYQFDKSLGKVSLRAEASVFPTLLDEISKLRNYTYLCNEQLASKLKALLLEKKIRNHLNDPFTHEKDVTFILKKLNQNRKPEGTWGWWQNTNEEIWISLHVVEALLQAEKQGYKIDLDKKVLYSYLSDKVNVTVGFDKIHLLKLIHLLDDRYYLKDWVSSIEKAKTLPNTTLNERLQIMRLKQLAGLKVNTDSLLKISKSTMFGSIYWGEEKFKIWDNSIQNTLLVYQILKANGGYAKTLNQIQLYFLEQRKDGQWRNTYESALILETILPEMLKNDLNNSLSTLTINNKTVNQFPYQQEIENVADLHIVKTGKMPIYFTAYQQYQNPLPQKVSKDFEVNTEFVQDNKAINQLTAGKMVKLKVKVNVRADADYVMIEIPIPAGCSYENKSQSFYGVETHREYFKEKTSLFCTKLKQGQYVFEIELMPRYTGSYVLNPAKAEMMYFPVFYGREGMKKVKIN